MPGVKGKQRRILPPFFTIFLSLYVFWCWLPGTAALAAESGQASSGPSIPQPPAESCIYDEAALLSEGTKGTIKEKNAALLEKYGVQLVVYTTDALPYTDFSQRVSYLRTVMESWQAGGNRWLVLALSVSDEDYLAVAGTALQEEFTAEALKNLLDAHVEPDFAAKSYDTAVSKFFAVAADKAESYCAARPELFPGASSQPEESAASTVKLGQKDNTGSLALLWVGILFGVILLGCMAAFFVRSRQLSRRRRRTVHRHNPTIRPARSSVMRQETRPAVQIKAGSRSTGVYRDQRSSRNRRL